MSAADLPLGLRYDLDIEAYHSGAGISKTGLDLIARSPYHYWARCLDPARPPPPEPTPAMRIGTMTHCAILEQDQFGKRYAVGPNVSTKAAKDWKEFVATLTPGVEPITEAEQAQVHAMTASVRAIAPLRDLLAAGDPEVSALFVDAPTGVLCRCRPDFVSPAGDGVVIMDLKTCVSASPSEFPNTVAKWHYDCQAAFYSDGWTAATGSPVHGFVIAAVEKEHPFAAAAYILDEEAIENGRRRYKRLLRTYAQCMRTGIWPGYTQGEEIAMLSLPKWSLEKVDE